MNNKIKNTALVVVLIALAGSGYYYSWQTRQQQAQSTQLDSYRQQNKDLFKQLGVVYLKQTEIVDPVVKQVPARDTGRYALMSEQADRLEKQYGALIAQGYVAPCTVRFINDAIGYGVFAEADIEPGQLVGEYTGRIINTKDLQTSKYSWDYPVDHDQVGNLIKTSLDAADAGNEMRFVNHDFKPNAEVQFIPQGGLWHVCYVATRLIKKGEQILTNYGTKYWASSRKGTMHTFVNEDGTQKPLL